MKGGQPNPYMPPFIVQHMNRGRSHRKISIFLPCFIGKNWGERSKVFVKKTRPLPALGWSNMCPWPTWSTSPVLSITQWYDRVPWKIGFLRLQRWQKICRYPFVKFQGWYCWWSRNLAKPVYMESSPSFIGFNSFIYNSWCRISSINSMSQPLCWVYSCNAKGVKIKKGPWQKAKKTRNFSFLIPSKSWFPTD